MDRARGVRDLDSNMNARTWLVGAVVLALAGVMLVCCWAPRVWPAPPQLPLVRVEPVGMIDASGADLWMVTFALSNTNAANPADSRADELYVRTGPRALEARVGNHWRAVTETPALLPGILCLPPGRRCESQLLTPAGTDACRLWLRYTGVRRSPSLKSWAAALAARLPPSLSSRLSYKFWRWVGFPGYEPSAVWREIGVVLPVSPATNTPAAAAGNPAPAR